MGTSSMERMDQQAASQTKMSRKGGIYDFKPRFYKHFKFWGKPIDCSKTILHLHYMYHLNFM